MDKRFPIRRRQDLRQGVFGWESDIDISPPYIRPFQDIKSHPKVAEGGFSLVRCLLTKLLGHIRRRE